MSASSAPTSMDQPGMDRKNVDRTNVDRTSVDRTSTETRPGSGAMFDTIARRYDLVNRILSFGLDQGWRRKAVSALRLPSDASRRVRVLDVATGTADVAIRAAKQYPDAEVVGVDPSTGMLETGRRKLAEEGLERRVELRSGEAERLPFDDDTFDGVTIAWGIRNAADRAESLREMVRVLRPGGRLVVLESLDAVGQILGPLIRLHLRVVVPFVGGLVTGRAKEYRYLQTSIEAFPEPDEFGAMLDAAGLEVESAGPLTFGACWLFVARKRPNAAVAGDAS